MTTSAKFVLALSCWFMTAASMAAGLGQAERRPIPAGTGVLPARVSTQPLSAKGLPAPLPTTVSGLPLSAIGLPTPLPATVATPALRAVGLYRLVAR
jgi:hypothetical protein